MRRVVISSAETCRDVLARGGFRWDTLLVTLTYRPAAKWEASHVRAYIASTNLELKRRKIRARYQWVIELTAAGVPHYHVLWWVPHGERLPMPDKTGSWPHGFSRIERASAPVGYLVKYATKGSTDVYELPKGARLFGVGGGMAVEKLATHRAGLPMWLLSRLPDDAKARRVAHVGWLDLSTGEIHQTPFSVCWGRDSSGFVVITITKREH